MASAAPAVATFAAPTKGYFAACTEIALDSLNGEPTCDRVSALAAHFDIPVGTVDQDVSEAVDALAQR